MALLASYTNSTTLAQGLCLGFLCWLGFAATVGLTANMFSEKPIAAWVLDAGYQLSYLVLMGVLLSVWRCAVPTTPPPTAPRTALGPGAAGPGGQHVLRRLLSE